MELSGRRTRRKILATGIGLIGLGTLAGCAAGGDLPPLPPTYPDAYGLGTGDTVRVMVFDQKQLTGDYIVGASGMIDIPLLGPVRARSLTTRQLGEQIIRYLVTRGILRRPSVSVEVRHYRPFSILGEVNKPGQYPFEPGMTVLAAVSLAGGFTYRAVESDVGVIRDRNGISREYRAPAVAFIAPGDVIKVFERHF